MQVKIDYFLYNIMYEFNMIKNVHFTRIKK